MATFRIGWYLLYTMPKQEKRVAKLLSEKYLNVYLPMVTAVSGRQHRIKPVQAPMFPSYIFIRLEKLHDYFDALNTDGVIYFVRFGGQIARVADTIVNDLKFVADCRKEVEISSLEFSQGEMLTIQEGPFAGTKCELVKHNRKDMVLVRISLIRRNVLMEFPSKLLIRS